VNRFDFFRSTKSSLKPATARRYERKKGRIIPVARKEQPQSKEKPTNQPTLPLLPKMTDRGEPGKKKKIKNITIDSSAAHMKGCSLPVKKNISLNIFHSSSSSSSSS